MKGTRAGNEMRRALVLFAALCMVATGCQRFNRQEEKIPQPPDFVKVTGAGTAGTPTAATTRVFTGILRGPVRANAATPMDRQIADPAQRTLMAQTAARRTALRALGRMIMETRDTQGATFGEALKKSPTDQSKLNQLLEEKAQVNYRTEGENVVATATIEGAQVVSALGATASAPAATGSAAASLEEKKTMAYNLALEDARKKLEQVLLETKLSDERTARQALTDTPEAQVDLNAMLWMIQPDETRYLPDGSCEVTIFFDRNRLPDIFKSKRHWWQPRLPWSKK